MDDLIRALQIFRKYRNPSYPTHCEHDQLAIMEIIKDMVSPEDLTELEKLGFFGSESDDSFISYKFGSA